MARKASILQGSEAPTKTKSQAEKPAPIVATPEVKEKKQSLLDKLVSINKCLGHKVEIKTSTGITLNGKIVNVIYDYLYIMVGTGDIKRCKLSMIKTCNSVP